MKSRETAGLLTTKQWLIVVVIWFLLEFVLLPVITVTWLYWAVFVVTLLLWALIITDTVMLTWELAVLLRKELKKRKDNKNGK